MPVYRCMDPKNETDFAKNFIFCGFWVFSLHQGKIEQRLFTSLKLILMFIGNKYYKETLNSKHGPNSRKK